MYDPVQKGIESTAAVRYIEAQPPRELAEYVHRFWKIESETEQQEDFYFHVLPDACIHIVFNLSNPEAAGITALRTQAEELNLGKTFDFVGIRFLPGVWQGGPDEIVEGVIDAPYAGKLPLKATGQELRGRDFPAQQKVLAQLVGRLVQEQLLTIDPITTSLLADIDDINSVADMADAVGMSARQLQRVLKRTTGFSPHDLLKVLRLQKSFVQDYQESYTDQSHYIHSFRKITGYTPSNFARKFGV